MKEKHTVSFHFDDGNTRQVTIENKSVEDLYDEITSCEGWYRYEKNKQTHAVNMKLVTHFNIN